MKRRIVHLISTYPPIGGGSELQCQSLARWQAAHGLNVHVVTRAQGTQAPAGVAQEDGVTVIRQGALPGRLPGALTFLARATWTASGLGAEILHAHQALSPGLAAITAARMSGARVIVKFACTGQFGELHEMQGPLLSLRRRWLDGADRCVVLSEEGRLEALSLGLDPRRIVKIPNGVDTARFAPPDPARRAQLRASMGLSGPVVLWTGRLTRQKSPDSILQAVASLPSGNSTTLLVAGDGPDRSACEELAREAGLGTRVRFLGWRADVPDLLAAADIFVLTSRSEGMSNALLEAMATARLVIAADIPANREVVDPGITGLLVPPGPEALAGALIQAAGALQTAGFDPASTEMGRAARVEIERRLSLEVVARRYVSLYDRLRVD